MNDQPLADRLKALAHPARLEILRVLANRGRCVCGEVVEVMPLAQATVSQHLKILKEAGLVRGRIDGRNSCYCLDPHGVAGLREALDHLRRPLGGRLDDTEPEEATTTRSTRRDPDAGARALRRDRADGGELLRPELLRLRVARDGAGRARRDRRRLPGVAGRLEEADLHLGCGVPTRHAALRPGETVLDLGGRGNDVFIARHEVGPRAACSGWT